MVEWCIKNSILPVAYAPLAAPYQKDSVLDPPSIFEDNMLKSFSENHNMTVAQVALAWNID